MQPKRVLIDNCVLALAETVQYGNKRVEVTWGDGIEIVEIAGIVGKTPRDKTQQAQLECLPTIARLAQNGLLCFCGISEVMFESWHRSGAMSSLPGYLFACTPFMEIPPAVERSRIIQQADIGKYVYGDTLAQFCKWLIGADEKLLLSHPGIRARFSPEEIVNLESLGRYRELCKGLSLDQCRDAFNLWSAEICGLDYFLTADAKFIRALTMRGKKPELPCLPVTPSVLLDIMGVTERDPLPFAPGQFYNTFEILD